MTVGGAAISAGVCLAACLALVWAEYRDAPGRRALFKILASSAFLALAVQLGAAQSEYGRLVLVALAFGWLGDVLLLSPRERCFLPGIGSFLLAHVAYAAAFWRHPVSGIAFALALGLLGALGAAVLGWLWRHLARWFRPAVAAYVVAIVAMCAVAVAASVATGRWVFAAGALAFAVSDVSVARDRFVAPGFVNRAWGLPLYYAAQIVLAVSVSEHP